MTIEECATCPRYSAKEQRQRNRLYCVFCCEKHIEQASKNALKYNLSVSGEDFGVEPEYEHGNKVYGERKGVEIMSMTIEEVIKHYEDSERNNRMLAGISVSALAKNHNLENAEKCRQMIEWLRILKKAKFEYDEAWRIITHPTPDVTYADRDRAQIILDTFRDSLGKME